MIRTEMGLQCLNGKMMWKEFEVEMVNSKEKEMGITRTFPSKCFIDMRKVIGIIENEDESDPIKPLVSIFLNSGESLNVYADYEDIKTIIERYITPMNYANS